MKAFGGFPGRVKFVAIPRVFFTDLLPVIDDIAELKVSLYLLQALYTKRGYPRYITDIELLSDRVLMSGVNGEAALKRGLRLATARGTLLSLAMNRSGRQVELYFLNTESDREACERIESGDIDIDVDVGNKLVSAGDAGDELNIFTLYEENIGMLTPMIAEELKYAEQQYPAVWIEGAFKEAVRQNKRNWKYVEAILKRWESEGRGHGEPGGNIKADPNKYIRGKYGHLVRRRID